MPHDIERTARGQIQAEAGELGEVKPRVVQTDAGHDAAGWYLVPAAEGLRERCTCRSCTAGRARRDAYIGFHRRDAIKALGRIHELHAAIDHASAAVAR